MALVKYWDGNDVYIEYGKYKYIYFLNTPDNIKFDRMPFQPTTFWQLPHSMLPLAQTSQNLNINLMSAFQ